MNEDPRCCGSGTCIIDNEDRCCAATGPAHRERLMTRGLTWPGEAAGWTRRRLAWLAMLGLLAPAAAGASAAAWSWLTASTP